MAAGPSLVAGLDLGGTKIQAVVMHGERIAGRARVPTPASSAADVVAALALACRQALDSAGAGTADLERLGMGTPGQVDRAAGTVSQANNVAGLSGTVPIAQLLSGQLGGVPVRLENDVRAAVLGEQRLGAGRGRLHFAGVWVGTGVGGGIVADGRLLTGRATAGEIGHVVVRPGGRRCSCGRRGHLEAYAGRGRQEITARDWAKAGRHTVLLDLIAERGAGKLTSGVLARALERRDPVATELVKEAVWALGIAISSLQNLLDLEVVIIGGGVGSRLGQPFADRIAGEMRKHLFQPERSPEVVTAELGDLAGAVGAALVAGEA